MLRVESPLGSRMQHGKCQLRFARFSRFTQLACMKTRLTQASRRHHIWSDNSFCRVVHACIISHVSHVIPACRSAFHAGVIVSIARVKSTCNYVSHSLMPPVTPNRHAACCMHASKSHYHLPSDLHPIFFLCRLRSPTLFAVCGYGYGMVCSPAHVSAVYR